MRKTDIGRPMTPKIRAKTLSRQGGTGVGGIGACGSLTLAVGVIL
jgi:hypothetical protein